MVYLSQDREMNLKIGPRKLFRIKLTPKCGRNVAAITFSDFQFTLHFSHLHDEEALKVFPAKISILAQALKIGLGICNQL